MKNIKITANDSFAQLNYVISVKITNPQFAGQTKEKLSNKDVTNFVATAVKDLLTIWLNQNPDEARQIVENISKVAQKRINADKKTTRKRIMNTTIRLPGKLTDCISSDVNSTELFIVEGILLEVLLNKHVIKTFKLFYLLKVRFLIVGN